MIKLLSLFSGLGAFEEALKNICIQFKIINYCEIVPYISKSYSLIHDISEDLNLGDITKVNEHELKDFDLMTYGFPCQDISSLGSQKGFLDVNGNLTRSGRFFDAIRIAKHKKPKYMIAENVRALVSKPMKEDFETMIKLIDSIGYNSYFKIINSKEHGIPHSRNRVFIISIRKDIDDGKFEFPNEIPLSIKASDLYDENVTPEFYLQKCHQKYFNDFRLKKKYSSLNSDVLICMSTKQGSKSCPQNFVHDDNGYRILTDSEMMAFQGFKKEYGLLLRNNGITTKQIGHMCGNSITVNVLENIFKKLFVDTL
ncbi:TPA: DNA (cytosine-5-)-methyltransferase [Clostridioides difficile]|nr:DNA (cytosine-5-)-methyltransferase [Clostridioides difficile]